ncbi:LemA family protein [Rhodoferax mekongensis]|uniref:LemA family protein n=1 Tax=Rhodoferax mekongensis TaxID=3068341 RepID=A0ABZ0AZR0_9BURK|nr:LemA family protein [Rhodoferax sp. TBRC 17307]NBX19860.1 hypothetical protein [Betaproteobacteria bacterium]WNO04960.1 LemA family protein [Rhodoferax sp. TBRC 17307]
MDTSIWLWLAVALTVFWLVGLYNRLMRLRSRALEVLTALERQLRSSLTLLETFAQSAQMTALTATNSQKDIAAEWMAVVRAAQVVEAIWYTPRKNTLSPRAQQKRSKSLSELQSAWDSWANTPPDLAGAPVPEDMQTEWSALQTKVKAIQVALNVIIESYNEAIEEYPAKWVAGWMGFEPSSKI